MIKTFVGSFKFWFDLIFNCKSLIIILIYSWSQVILLFILILNKVSITSHIFSIFHLRQLLLLFVLVWPNELLKWFFTFRLNLIILKSFNGWIRIVRIVCHLRVLHKVILLDLHSMRSISHTCFLSWFSLTLIFLIASYLLSLNSEILIRRLLLNHLFTWLSMR
jgi:hypothetical protein